jgi:hypothetical protein
MTAAPLPEVTTADNPDVAACTLGGVDHDWRPHTGTQHNRPHTWWRCVWCHVVSCGNFTQPDPCMQPYHHRGNHRTRTGITWPIGGTRP